MNFYRFLYCVLFIFGFTFSSQAQESQNMELFDLANSGDVRYSGSWVYLDGHAYVVTEGRGVGEGMQVIDLNFLPTNARLLTTYNSSFTTGHIIQRDIYSDLPFVYVNGVCNNCGVNILDVSNPERPRQVGLYNPGYYIHDCHVKGDYLYAAAFLEGTIDIVDISDKTRPVLKAQIDDPGGNTHSSWLTEDSQYLIISDELDGLPARIWNIADLDNMFEVATYTANESSLTHNPYVRGDFAFFSHNTEGIRVVDIKDPRLPLEVGFYDTFDRASGGFNGLWSAWITDFDLIINEEEGKLLPSGQYGIATLDTLIDLSIVADGFFTIDTLIDLEVGDQKEVTIHLSPLSVSTSDYNKLSNKVKVYPNPYRHATTLDLSAIPTASRIEIYNSTMRLLYSRTIEYEPLFELKEEGQGSGVFYYMIYDEEERLIATGRVLKI